MDQSVINTANLKATEVFFLEKDLNKGPANLSFLEKIKSQYSQLTLQDHRNLFISRKMESRASKIIC